MPFATVGHTYPSSVARDGPAFGQPKVFEAVVALSPTDGALSRDGAEQGVTITSDQSRVHSCWHRPVRLGIIALRLYTGSENHFCTSTVRIVRTRSRSSNPRTSGTSAARRVGACSHSTTFPRDRRRPRSRRWRRSGSSSWWSG